MIERPNRCWWCAEWTFNAGFCDECLASDNHLRSRFKIIETVDEPTKLQEAPGGDSP